MNLKRKNNRRYFPLLLNIEGKKCLIVGGGRVAYRKAKIMLSFGAKVTIIAPQLSRTIKLLARNPHLVLKQRKVKRTDLRGAELVFSATNDTQLNARIASWAKADSIPVNVVDSPELCTFIMPAILQRGALQIAISTAGEFPALAQKIRNELAHLFPPDFSAFLKLLGKYRRKLIKSKYDEQTKKTLLSKLCSDYIYRLFKRKGRKFTENFISNLLESYEDRII
ncbi:MAG: bifunctional precorrin-2 dehydrogenase/sirohydrochlorin ferrochelatase [Candidatus Sumerlaeia bacterium]|nr:bifunctional precorrin-2 dehydrogenase/sirohydrochlorin ferrochelatase [Candidatus Sumerlaeia bacterium]